MDLNIPSMHIINEHDESAHQMTENIGKKERFIKIYSNTPAALRKEIIVIVDDKPFTWNAAYIEVKNDTGLGAVILKKLSGMGLI